MSSKGWGAPTVEPVPLEDTLNQRVATLMWIGVDKHEGYIGVAGDIFAVRAGNTHTTPYSVLKNAIKEAAKHHDYDRMVVEICWLNYHKKCVARALWRGSARYVFDQLVENASRIAMITKARMGGIPVVIKNPNAHVHHGLATEYTDFADTVLPYDLNDPQFSYHSLG